MYSRFHFPLCVAALWVAAVAVAWAGEAPALFNAECEPTSGELARFDMDVNGQARVARTVTVSPVTRVLVLAQESGIDVRMEARIAGAKAISSADNPLRRWAVQRITIDMATAPSFELAAIGKERAKGQVKVRVYALNGFSAADDCLNAQRASADADASYARGQLITLTMIAAAPGDAQRAYERALDGYVRAQAFFKRRGAMAAQARAGTEHAATLYTLRRYAEARDTAQRASAAFAAAGGGYGADRAKSIEASSEMEVAFYEPGRNAAQSAAQARAKEMLAHARALFAEVAKNHQARGESVEQALALNSIGNAFYYDESYEEAIAAFRRALEVYEKMGERMRQAQTLQNIGVVQNEMAQFPQAFETYARALKLLDEAENPKLYGDFLNNLALSEYETGRPDSALRHYSEALAIMVRVQSTLEQARSLHGIGATYYRIGNRVEALKYFERALALRSAKGDPVGRIASLRSAADTLRDSGRWPEAFARREEALRLAPMPSQRARILVELARDAVDSGANERANAYFAELFRDDAAGDVGLYARALLERAKAGLARGTLDLAQRDVNEALSLFRVQQLLSPVFSGLVLQARIECARADASSARTSIESALDLAEQLRRSSNNPTLRASLWQPLRPAFDFKISMISDPGVCGGGRQGGEAALAALEVSERSRGRALEDFRLLGALRGASPGLSAAERRRAALYEQLAARRLQIESISESAADDDPRLKSLRAEVSGLIRELDILGGDIGSPLRGREGKRAAVRHAIEMISPDAAVVEYWLGEKNSYAWLASKGRTKMINLGSTARIDASATALHRALRNFTSVSGEERLRLLRELHALIIEPLPAEALRAGTLYFVPDGALHAVPFAALVQGSGTPLRFLVDSRDIAVIPSIADAAVRRGEIRTRADAVLVVADPVYSRDDARFPRTAAAPPTRRAPALTLRGGAADDTTNGPQRWERLPGAGREAAAIVRLLEGADVEVLEGFAANRENLLARNLQRYQILHFATHSVADTQVPQLSALVLSTLDAAGAAISGEVFAGDLMLQKLHADLLVLSACDTALGQANTGEGLLGLRYAAHAAGARFVVASLWPVTDTVGEQLMAGLYAGMTRRGKTPVQALSEAMRATRAQWPDPALWAVFEVSQAGSGETIH